MACGGFTCSRNSLAFLNVIYIMVAILLITVAAYGKAVAIIATLQVLGGIIGCGVFLLLISILGLIGAIKHHQVLLFFYMIILFLLFLVQFAVACACLAVTDTQQQHLYDVGWENSNAELQNRTQKYFQCCGHNKDHQDNLNGSYGHPVCGYLDKCNNSTAVCCTGIFNVPAVNQTSTTPPPRTCPCDDCWTVIAPKLCQAAKVAGFLGLFFSFTELLDPLKSLLWLFLLWALLTDIVWGFLGINIIGVWLAFRFRNQKDPRPNPSAFL